MKNLLKSIPVFMVLAICSIFFAACNDGEDERYPGAQWECPGVPQRKIDSVRALHNSGQMTDAQYYALKDKWCKQIGH